MFGNVYSFSVKRILLGLCAIAFLISLVSPSSAKSARSLDAARSNPAIAVVFVGDQQTLKVMSAADLKARVVRFLHNAGLNPKSIKVVSNDCGCPFAGQEASGGFGSCLKDCMADVGVSAMALIMCGAACAAAGTGVGAIACAVCVGVSVTVVVTCALGCATYPKGFGVLMDARNAGPHPDRGLKRARRTVKTVSAHSLYWSSI